MIASGNDKILIGVPSSLSTPYGVADDTDHINGTTLAVEEINAAGGVLGREIELFVPDVDKLNPESCRAAIAACITGTLEKSFPGPTSPCAKIVNPAPPRGGGPGRP